MYFSSTGRMITKSVKYRFTFNAWFYGCFSKQKTNSGFLFGIFVYLMETKAFFSHDSQKLFKALI